jgi:hypothetical protein
MKNDQKKMDVVVHACNPSYLGGRGRKISNLRPACAKVTRPYLKNKIKTNRLGYSLSGRELV